MQQVISDRMGAVTPSESSFYIASKIKAKTAAFRRTKKISAASRRLRKAGNQIIQTIRYTWQRNFSKCLRCQCAVRRS